MRRKVPSTNSALEALHKPQHPDRKHSLAFASVNVLCFGDFWQLDPTGDVAFASNPLNCIGIPDVDRTMVMFWHKSLGDDASNFHMQAWQAGARVRELNQNMRSGEDEWFSEVLDQCRLGNPLE